MGNLNENLIDFDPDSSHDSEQNIEAARQRGLRFDYNQTHYVDEDRLSILDRFGQPLSKNSSVFTIP